MPRATKKPKDANAPKRNQTSYFIFSNERRPILQSENKGMSVTNIAKAISGEWKLLSADQKKVYEKRAASQKERYVEEMAEYKKTDNFSKFEKKMSEWKQTEKDLGRGPKGKGKTKGSRKKPKQPESMPKKPQTSYFIFNNERRKELKEQYPEKKITELAKLIGGEWKTMTDAEKAKYVEQAKVVKEEYAIKIAEYKKTEEYQKYMQELDAWKKEAKDADNEIEVSTPGADGDGIAKVRLPRRPKDAQCPKRPLSSYFLFTKEARAATKQEFPEKSVTEIAKELSRKWKALTEEEKKPYNEGAARLKEQYKKDIETYEGTKAHLEYKQKLEEWKQECAECKQAAKLRAQKLRQAKKVAVKKGKSKVAAKKGGKKGAKDTKKKMSKKRRSVSSDDSSDSDSDSDSYSSDDSSSGSSSGSDESSSSSSESDSSSE